MKNRFKIAIDGPVGVGKGTLAIALAKKFDALYINTGAMYRALTLACMRSKIDIRNENEILKLLRNISIELRLNGEGRQKVILSGEDISSKIFLPEVSNTVAHISPFPKIREELVRQQKAIAEKHERVVIEGRDIATEVAPDADIKIFLTADVNTRAKRRQIQMQKNNIEVKLNDVLKETVERDRRDMERETSPLTITEDAYVLDTTNLSIEETVDKVVEKMKEDKVI